MNIPKVRKKNKVHKISHESTLRVHLKKSLNDRPHPQASYQSPLTLKIRVSQISSSKSSFLGSMLIFRGVYTIVDDSCLRDTLPGTNINISPTKMICYSFVSETAKPPKISQPGEGSASDDSWGSVVDTGNNALQQLMMETPPPPPPPPP